MFLTILNGISRKAKETLLPSEALLRFGQCSKKWKKILLYSVTYLVFAIFWLYLLYLASLQNATDADTQMHTYTVCMLIKHQGPHTQHRFKDTLLHFHARTFTLRCTHCWRVSLSICDINDNKPLFHAMNCLCGGTVC